MAWDRPNPEKEGLIGIQEAADYLKCSHQVLGRHLKDPKHPLRKHFRFYAGRWWTTYALLDEFFTLKGAMDGLDESAEK